MKKLILICLTILIFSSVSAIKINEIEINPEDGRYGKEWIELYNNENEDIDISGWEVWEGVCGSSGPKKILSITNGTVIPEKGFYIIEWGSKLNNVGDFVILYDNEGNEIDETETLEEGSSSTKTWQLCEGWKFLEATKGKKNNCEVENENETEEEEETEDVVEEEIIEDVVEETVEKNLLGESDKEEREQTQTPLTPEVISLTPKDIKSRDNIESLDKTDYAKYGFIGFCILIGVLLILKNKRKQKNEII